VYYKPQIKVKYGEQELKDEIVKIYQEIPFYGYVKTNLELKSRGFKTNVKEVTKIRQELGLRTLIPQKRSRHKRKDHEKYPYLLKHLKPKHSNHVWASDITYIKLRQGTLYKVAIMDIFSRKILGYKISNSLSKAFCVDLLAETIDKYGVPKIFNTDQGSQFTSEDFLKVLKKNHVKISMDGVGRALDNIFIERYWKSYKYENVYLYNYFNVFDAKLKTSKYVEFYNSKRFHSALDYLTPDEVYFSNLPKGFQAMQNEVLLKNMC